MHLWAVIQVHVIPDMHVCCYRGFPVEQYKGDRLGLVLAFWGLGIVLGRPLVSQTDYTEENETFGEGCM